VAEVIRRAPKASRNDIWILNISGRGDKDMEILAQHV
jgi:tryptophan synthase beta subunit